MRAAVAAAMSTFLYTLLGLAAGSSLHCAERRDISPCSCRAQEPGQPLKVACERVAGLSAVLAALAGRFPPETEVALRVAYSELHDLPAHTFQQLGLSIHTLMLNHDNLSALPEEAFSGLGRTEYLSLADNVLTLVPRAALRHMPRLRTLDLGRGAVAALHHGDLQDLPELQHLVLAGNALARLDAQSLPPALRHLHLGRNRLSALNGTLRGLSQLEWLFVNGNQLAQLDGELPAECAQLLLLHAASNRLRRLPAELRACAQLESLFAQGNELEALGGALQRARRLRRLHLSHNRIAQVSEDEFQELEALEELQLGHNRLRELNGSLLPLRALRCLNLTHNRFERFSLREILGLRRLFVIDLSANNISALAGHVAQNVVDAETRVVELRLEHNRLRALDGALMGLHGLQRLNLSHNLLEQIMPDDLIGLEGLRVLDISFNRLKTLEETSKTFLPSLEGLFASNNLLTSLQQDFHGLPTLCWADLANNQIETIGRELAAKTRCRIHGVLGTLRIYLYENPVRCDTNLIETVVAMEANFTKLYGLAPCVAENLTTSVAA
ncbi:hypothetical protein R5R35_012048 [Gryllus longicercus]|uniref:Insulin-like growth factor-binding protein complex acid labile subunit n=1 Tax=Gryllus longicercus TaxID=2509291 RepID=A0AAN9VCK3_9ORTH